MPMTFLFSEPVDLNGDGVYNKIGWEYNLNVVKEIKVTKSFLGLDEKTKECQNEMQFEECTTSLYLEKIKNSCKCLPFNLWLNNSVSI